MPNLPYIKINGEKYELDPDPQVESAAEIPQKYTQPQDESDFWQTWEMRSWQAGERRTRILTKDQVEEMTYDDGEHVDISTWGELKLQPALSRSGGLYAMSSTMPMAVSNDGQTVVVGHSVFNAKYLSTYTSTTWTQRTTPNAAAVTDIIVGIADTMYAIQGYRIIESTDSGNTTWANSTKGRITNGTAQAGADTSITLAVGSSASNDYYNGMQIHTTGGTGPNQLRTITDYDGGSKVATVATWGTNPSSDTTYDILSADTPTTMVGLAFCANELYALTASALKYYDGSAWQVAAYYGGDFVATYNEQVYFIDAGILYRYNGTSCYEADRMPAGFTASGLYPYGGVLFIPGYWNVQGGKKGSCFYIMEGRRAHLYNIGSLDGSSDYTIKAVAGSDDEVYVANQKRGGVDRFDMSRTGGVSSGPAWGSAGIIPFKGIAYANGKVLVARYTSGDHTSTIGAGSTDTATVLNASASAVNDYYNGMYLSVTSGTGANQVALITDYTGSSRTALHADIGTAAAEGDTYYIGTSGVYLANVAIPTAYETSGWITTPEFDWFLPHDQKLFSKIVVEHKALATGQTIKVEYSLDGGTIWTLAGFSDTVGSTSKELTITNAKARSLKLRVTLTGPGTSTPTITYMRVDAGPLGEATSLWDYNLAAFSPLQGRRRLENLRAAYLERAVVEHEDLYKEKHNCVFEYLKIRPVLGDKWTVRVFLRLREV